jgi:kynureninase
MTDNLAAGSTGADWRVIVMNVGELSIERARELDAADPLAPFRDKFVFADPKLVYLNGNSLGALPKRTQERLRQVIDTEWGQGLGQSWDHWVDLPEQAGEAVAPLIGAASGQTIVTDNTTTNLYKLAIAALEARPGRHVIVTDDDNFPTDRYVLEGVTSQRNLEFRKVSTDFGEGVDPDLLRRAVDDDTALVSLSHVSYRSGALADMATITEIAHQSGALIMWDLCHSVGALPIHLDDCDADLAVGCTYKYMNAGPGAPAFLYVSARLRNVLRQPIWGWFSQRNQFAMGQEYRPAEGMVKFMTGTPNIPGAAAVQEGARLLAEAGIDRIRTKSVLLTAYLEELADEWLTPLGCALATPRDPERRGSHLTFAHPDAESIVAELAKADIVTDFRTPGRFRFGLSPLTTRFTDAHNAAAATRDLLIGQNSNG